jgi:hypothetical protein
MIDNHATLGMLHAAALKHGRAYANNNADQASLANFWRTSDAYDKAIAEIRGGRRDPTVAIAATMPSWPAKVTIAPDALESIYPEPLSRFSDARRLYDLRCLQPLTLERLAREFRL